jgi:hypothetical protein
MEKVSLKELYQRFTADKKGTQKLFITHESFYGARDCEICQIKDIAPNPRKAEAIRTHDEYEDYVPDFNFEVVNPNDKKDIASWDGHAGYYWYVSTDINELKALNDKRLEDYYIKEVGRSMERIAVPRIKVVGERTAHLNELISEFRTTIEKITNYTNAA